LKKYVIIVAGGTGKRMGLEPIKQFLCLNGIPILMHSINAFYQYDEKINIVLVLPREHIDEWSKLCKRYNFNIIHTVTEGGETRFHSVKNGLSHVNNSDSLVAVHDGVRPLVAEEVIKRSFDYAEEKGTAVPCVTVNDSLRMLTEKYSRTIDRKNVRAIQTPQCFRAELLKKAYEQEYDDVFTDDATVIENLGGKIYLVEGNIENIKITTPLDLQIAETLMMKRI
jgi:2-C-methyl-D-erythritol 4-phosphate cytidylyltransferase